MKDINSKILGITALESDLLLAHVLGVSRADLYMRPEKIFTEQQKQDFLLLVSRRQAGEPLAYLVGSKEFWSLPLVVSKAVLIPRPETECLVASVLDKINNKMGALRVLDLGTGSGAIALALATERPKWKIIGIDRSAEALKIAVLNAKNLGIGNIEFIQSDWFSHFASSKSIFDVVVGNPPYIDPQDPHLQGDIRYEPKDALVSQSNGFADLEKIIDEAPNYLASKGWLFLEHAFNQGDSVKKCMESRGFIECQGYKDLSGTDRITIGRLSS